jgi:hypothetical protein
LIEQTLTGLAESPRERSDRPAEPRCRVRLAHSFEFAQNKGSPFRFRQLPDFLVNRVHQCRPRFIRNGPVPLRNCRPVFALTAADSASPNLDRHTNGHSVQPGR